MPLPRRAFVASAGVSPLLPLLQGRSLQATPAIDEPLPPDVLFERLRDTPVSTPLFPSDLPQVTIVPWVDDSDDDLEGVVGGLLVQAGAGEESPLLGVYIVHPTFAMAEERIGRESLPDVERVSILGRTGVWQPQAGGDHNETGTLIGVVDGLTIVSALAEGNDAGANDLRALAILAGMLDHLRIASTGDEG